MLDSSPSFRYIELDETASTNSFLADYRPLQPAELTLVSAEYQTAGRGQTGNSWESAAGQNLLFSLLLHPVFLPPTRLFLLSEAIALSIRDALGSFLDGQKSLRGVCPDAISVKWPNDIYVGDRKVCGILIECRLQGEWVKDCIAGIGLNVNQRQFLSDAPNPTSMALESGQDFDRDEVLRVLLGHFSQILESWDEAAIRSAYRSLLYRREGYWPYSDGEGRFEARLKDVEDDGHLVLEDRAGSERRYAFKEVVFLHNASCNSKIVK